MKKKEKEKLPAIKVKKRKSGTKSNIPSDSDYSFDDFDNDYYESYFDDDFSFLNENRASSMILSPLIIQYKNSIDSDIQGTLFGYNDFSNSPNFNNAEIEISTLHGGSYKTMIAHSQNEPLRIGKWRFQASGANIADQLAITVKINQVDAINTPYSVPMNLSIMRDAYQQQEDILDVTRSVTIDGNTFISFPVKANTALVISLFVIDIASAKSRLNGGNNINRRHSQQLSGKNVAPVIIVSS